jgi:thioredoxin reductase/bacterioferritin-associated ferredoxin
MMHDILVLGGGPAGMAAATQAARRGARVALVDEQPAPGGQVYRAPAPGLDPPADADRREGNRLRAALAESGAAVFPGHLVWDLGGGPLVAAGAPDAPFRIQSLGEAALTLAGRALILAGGTSERIIPFPGWTLPGVMGLAATTILLKAEAMLPGRAPLLAGAGPLLYAVAAKLVGAGVRPVAVVDLAGHGEWLAALPALAARPDLLLRGAAWRAMLLAARVPVLAAHRLVAAEGADGVTHALVQPLAGGAVRRFAVDCICVGHGLVPATEGSRAYRADHTFDAARGGWVAAADAAGRTSVAKLYVAGDGAGLRGAAAAPASGRLAALAALADLGLGEDRAALAAATAEQARAARTGAAMARMMALRPALVAAIPPETVVCRCEGVTRAAIEAAVAAGAREVNQLKHFTRCLMGPCQGRLCGEAAAELVACQVGGREAAGLPTGRVPLRPVPMAALLGDFAYADIPVPPPAPL